MLSLFLSSSLKVTTAAKKLSLGQVSEIQLIHGFSQSQIVELGIVVPREDGSHPRLLIVIG